MSTATSNCLLWKEMYICTGRESPLIWNFSGSGQQAPYCVSQYVDRQYINQGVHNLHKIPNLNISARVSWSVSELLKLFKTMSRSILCYLVILKHNYLLFKMEIWKIINFLEFWFLLYIALYNVHVCNVPVLSPFSMPLSRMYWIIFRYCNSSCFLGFTFSSLIGNVEDSRAELSKPSTANIFRRCDSYCQQMKGWKKIPNCRVIIFIFLVYWQIVKTIRSHSTV